MSNTDRCRFRHDPRLPALPLTGPVDCQWCRSRQTDTCQWSSTWKWQTRARRTAGWTDRQTSNGRAQWTVSNSTAGSSLGRWSIRSQADHFKSKCQYNNMQCTATASGYICAPELQFGRKKRTKTDNARWYFPPLSCHPKLFLKFAFLV